jgi:hypothetical protein
MARGKQKAKLEHWLLDLRVLIMWSLRDEQPHEVETLKDLIVRFLAMLWRAKKPPTDLGDPHERATAEINRLLSHRNCQLIEHQESQKVRLIQVVKTYQPVIDELVELEQAAAPYIRTCQQEGGWHSVAELLPPKAVKGLGLGASKRYLPVVLEGIVARLKAEGCQSRTGEAGEELYFGPASTTSTSEPAPPNSPDPDREADRPFKEEGALGLIPSSPAHTPLPDQLGDSADQERLPAPSHFNKDLEDQDSAETCTPPDEHQQLAPEPTPGLMESPTEQVSPALPLMSVRDEVAHEAITARTGESLNEAEPIAGQSTDATPPAGNTTHQAGGTLDEPIAHSSTLFQQRHERRAPMPITYRITLGVHGPTTQIDRFARRARGKHDGHQPIDGKLAGASGAVPSATAREVPLLFHALCPLPSDALAADAEMRERCRREHWGCTSENEPGNVTVRRLSPNRVEYVFATVSGPPLKWLERVAEDFPMLDFDLYFIAAWEAHGRRIYTRGELSLDWEEQPTAEDHARAGILDQDYCGTCAEPLNEDDGSCPHCEELNASGAKVLPVETTTASDPSKQPSS